MNKQEWINDLVELQSRQKNIEGAIQYVIGKIRDIESLEMLKNAEEKEDE